MATKKLTLVAVVLAAFSTSIIGVLARDVIEQDEHDGMVNSSEEHAALHSNAGSNLYAEGEFIAARREFTFAIRLNPGMAGVYYNRGNTNFRLRSYEAALEDYSEAVRIAPRFAMALANRGNALSALGRLDEALESLDTAAALEPHNPYVLFNRGFVYGRRRDYAAAQADFTKVLKINPNDVDALVLRAAAYRLLGMFDKAFRDSAKARSLDPTNTRLRPAYRTN